MVLRFSKNLEKFVISATPVIPTPFLVLLHVIVEFMSLEDLLTQEGDRIYAENIDSSTIHYHDLCGLSKVSRNLAYSRRTLLSG